MENRLESWNSKPWEQIRPRVAADLNRHEEMLQRLQRNKDEAHHALEARLEKHEERTTVLEEKLLAKVDRLQWLLVATAFTAMISVIANVILTQA